MKKYLTWFCLAIWDLAFTLFACGLVNWWAAWWADEDGWLPDGLAWFQTFDAPLDAGWLDRYPGYVEPTGVWSQWWERTKWLYRNPAYGFGYWPLGTSFDPKLWVVKHFEQSDTRDLFIAYGPDGTFNVAYYGWWGSLKIGWKAWNYFDPATRAWRPGYQWGPLMRVPEVFSINPFRRK